MRKDKETPEETRERLRQEELKNHQAVFMVEACPI